MSSPLRLHLGLLARDKVGNVKSFSCGQQVSPSPPAVITEGPKQNSMFLKLSLFFKEKPVQWRFHCLQIGIFNIKIVHFTFKSSSYSKKTLFKTLLKISFINY